MLRNVLLALLALVIAVGGGTLSAWYAVNRFDGFGSLRIGQWTGYPDAGTPQSDPYAKARAAREGAFPLGSAEGLAFMPIATIKAKHWNVSVPTALMVTVPIRGSGQSTRRIWR